MTKDYVEMLSEFRRSKAKVLWDIFITRVREDGYEMAFLMLAGHRKGSKLYSGGFLPPGTCLIINEMEKGK